MGKELEGYKWSKPDGENLTSEHRLLGFVVGRGALKKGSKGTELEGALDLLRYRVPLWSGSHLRQVGSGGKVGTLQ